MTRSVYWFAIVGLSALGIHFFLVTKLFVPFGVEPLYANIGAYIIAFQVSYFGHRWFTFNANLLSHGQTLPRFIIVSLCGFLLNQTMFYLLLEFTSLNYALALLIVLFSVAAFTFIFSKLWAFRKA